MLQTAIILGLLNSTILLSFMKWGWIDLYQMHRKEWMPDNCFLCFGFWLAWIEVIILFFVMPSWGLLLVPFLATPITRKLI